MDHACGGGGPNPARRAVPHPSESVAGAGAGFKAVPGRRPRAGRRVDHAHRSLSAPAKNPPVNDLHRAPSGGADAALTP